MRLSSLQCLEVVNIIDGRRLGFISDIVFILPIGQIEAIVVEPALFRRFYRLFFGYNELVIPWCQVVTVGEDVVLVNLGI